jgi:ABC-type glycerol-3-phosphate transport system substrate-binding protein
MRKYMGWIALLLIAVLALSACTAMPAAPAAEAPATEAAAEEAPAADAAAEGAYAGVDPTGQTVVWWHQHSGSREEKSAGDDRRVQREQ